MITERSYKMIRHYGPYSILLEDYSQWRGNWVHYSMVSYLKLNYHTSHLDPIGVYLFPEKFDKLGGQWKNYPYRFIIQVPSLKILDLDKLSRADAVSIMEKLGIFDTIDAKANDYRGYMEKINYRDTFWEALQRKYSGKPAAFNTALRSLGYDAVFDDTNSIFPNEVQLVILDPSKIKVLDIIDQKGIDGLALLKEADDLAKILKKYGNVKIGPIRKIKFGGETWTRVSVDFNKNGKEFSADINVIPSNGKKYKTDTVSVTLSHSVPRTEDRVSGQYRPGIEEKSKKYTFDKFEELAKEYSNG